MDATVRVWDAVVGLEIRSISLGQSGTCDGVQSVAFTPDGKALAASTREPVSHMWDVVTGEELAKLEGHLLLAFSPDGNLFASRNGASGRTGRGIQVLDADAGREIFRLRGTEPGICSVSFSPDSRVLATGMYDTTVLIWDLQRLKELNAATSDRRGSGEGVMH
jgi:WD40 repeat protein